MVLERILRVTKDLIPEEYQQSMQIVYEKNLPLLVEFKDGTTLFLNDHQIYWQWLVGELK